LSFAAFGFTTPFAVQPTDAPHTFFAGTKALSHSAPKVKSVVEQAITGDYSMAKKLYVGNLSYDVDSSALQQMFTSYGTVQSAEIISDRETGRSKGFGFVQLGSDSEADAAIAALNGQQQNGRALTVNEAKPREDRPRTGGGGRSGGGYGGGGGGRSGGSRY
jgi:RNA recognition motif-containing protein